MTDVREESGQQRALGFVGLGAMGSRMAARLLEHGRRLVVHDTSAAAVAPLVALGATAARSAREVADSSAIVFMSLPTPEIVAAVCVGPDGISDGRMARTVVDLSTTGPSVSATVARKLTERGITYVDCPVSGGTAGAERGSLAVMVAAPPAAVDEVRELLGSFGNVFVVGTEAGQAQIAKVTNNLLSATAILATGEALALAVKSGLDPAVLLDVFNAGSGRNTASADKYPRAVLPRTFDVGFRLALMAKDVRLCLDEAERRRVPMLLASTVEQLWSLAESQNTEAADCTEIVQMLESWAGVTITSPNTPVS